MGSASPPNRALYPAAMASSQCGFHRQGRIPPSRNSFSRYALAASRVLTPATPCLSPDGPDPSETALDAAPWLGQCAGIQTMPNSRKRPRNLRWRIFPAGPALHAASAVCFMTATWNMPPYPCRTLGDAPSLQVRSQEPRFSSRESCRTKRATSDWWHRRSSRSDRSSPRPSSQSWCWCPTCTSSPQRLAPPPPLVQFHHAPAAGFP